MKRYAIFAVAVAVALAVSGCATQRYAGYRNSFSEVDTLRLMTKDDVISLAKAGVNDDVIINQVKATGSYFELSTQDIVDLANAGVSDKVIEEMIKTDQTAQSNNRDERYYYYNPYWFSAYPFVYPWYPSFFLGFSHGYQWPYYGHRAYFSHYNSIGHGGFSNGRGLRRSRSGGQHR